MKARIKIIGWKEDFRKVSCTKLLMDYSDLSLSEAKNITDKILESAQVIVLVDTVKAKEFITKATEIGAIVK